MRRLGFPIRVKLLLAVLAIVMMVVTLITVTMASLFHDDKTTYIRDLTSIMAVQLSRETNVIVQGYTANLSMFANVLFDAELAAGQKQSLIQDLYSSFNEIIAVSVAREDTEPVMVYDAATLQDASIQVQQMLDYQTANPPPFDRLADRDVWVRNATFNDAMPMMSITVLHQSVNDPARTALVGFIRLDRLMELAGRSATFETWISDSEGYYLAHTNKSLVLSRTHRDGSADNVVLGSHQATLSTTLDYERKGEQFIGGFARTEIGGMNTGIEIPRAAAYLTARELLSRLVVTALILFCGATLASLLMAHRLTRPLDRLTQAVRYIGKGHFDVQVPEESKDELGMLAQSFNQMTHELKDRDSELQKAHQALVQSEKMAAFGQLGAGIAHEVKNPLAGILGYAQLALRKLSDDSPLRNHLSIIEKETKRCTEIITNLLKFARQEKAEQVRMSINTVVTDALDIVDHQLSINQVSIEKMLAPDLPPIFGNANQLQQVLMNFAVNAQQAMKGTAGVFTVATRLASDETVEIRVSDNGPGMPAEVREKIFEPFFTTKPAGEGTGLGLSVSYGIIRDHGGNIVVESEPGQGTCFIVSLPVSAVPATPASAPAPESAPETAPECVM